MKILISPYSAHLPGGHRNAKEYPWWMDLTRLLVNQGHELTQIGTPGEMRQPGTVDFIVGAKFSVLKGLVLESDLWIAVDNFLQHFVNCEVNKKPGVVIWSQSDPKIFGYPYNLNLLKDRKYLRQFQFDSWLAAQFNEESFMAPADIMFMIEAWLKRAAVFRPPVDQPGYDARFDM